MIFAPTQGFTLSTSQGPTKLGPLPCYFAPNQSISPWPGFEAFEVEDIEWETLPVLGLESAPAPSGTLLVPQKASAWLALFDELASEWTRFDASIMHWKIGERRQPLGCPLVMGIVNVTPDSFSDGGRFLTPERAIAHGHQLVKQGADILDVGGESTRPGSQGVSTQLELERVIPVIAGLKDLGVPLSIDTQKAEVARQAIGAGASIVNDVSGLRDPDMASVVAEKRSSLVLMHMRGTPETMQSNTDYPDLRQAVLEGLEASLRRAHQAGIALDRILVDPGIGFGKDLQGNLALLSSAFWLRALGRPTLLGFSRKRFLGEITGKVEGERRAATVAASVLACHQGAAVFRVHDVDATRDAVAVFQAFATSELTHAR